MRELSIFVDESGDFGETRDARDYYLVTFVFHNQEDDINEDTIKLEKSVKESGLDIEYIHSGPVIRKEGVFKEYSLDERRKLISWHVLSMYYEMKLLHSKGRGFLMKMWKYQFPRQKQKNRSY